MKKVLSIISGATCLLAINALAAPVFEDDFTYPDGQLGGQGPWNIIGGGTTLSPVLVSSGQVLVEAGIENVSAGYAPTANPDGTSFYVGLTINAHGAHADSGSFLHVTPVGMDGALFYNELFIEVADHGGFYLGFRDNSDSSTITYGNIELSLATDYRIVIAQNMVAGADNDTFAVYVVAGDSTTELPETPYLTHTWAGGGVEASTYDSINISQNPINTPRLRIDDLIVSKSYEDVKLVPEPSTYFLLLGGMCVLGLRMKSKRV